jgi:glycosyltransferase involved in cell wall biosynthesis
MKQSLLKMSYSRIDSITYLRNNVRKVIEEKNKKIELTFLPVGADFDHFKPMNKLESRKKLNLPLKKIIGVYVGKWYRLKGVDHILSIFNYLKSKNFYVIFVGGSEKDELYSDVLNSGCPYWGYVNHDLLRVIYAASDFYIHPVFEHEHGGLDVSLMEALACNRPVLSTMLNELNFDYSELGILIDKKEDVINKTEKMIEQFGRFRLCREKAIYHLDGNTAIVDKLHKIYIR